MTTTTKKPRAKAAKPAAPKALPGEIAMGQILRDTSSGYSGVAMSRAKLMSGTIQWGLQVPSEDGKPTGDPTYIDDHMLEIIDYHVQGKLPPVDDTVTLKIGQFAEDIVTGVRGVITEEITFQNGCVFFAITQRRQAGSLVVPHMRLKLSAPTFLGRLILRLKKLFAASKPAPVVVAKAEPKPEPKVEPAPPPAPRARRPGGPMRAVPSMRG